MEGKSGGPEDPLLAPESVGAPRRPHESVCRRARHLARGTPGEHLRAGAPVQPRGERSIDRHRNARKGAGRPRGSRDVLFPFSRTSPASVSTRAAGGSPPRRPGIAPAKPSSDARRGFDRPAAAVIPAPIAYIKVVAVKKLVVELMVSPQWSAFTAVLFRMTFGSVMPGVLYWMRCISRSLL